MNVDRLDIRSQDDLNQVLKDHNIDTGKWVKSPQSLYKEIKAGECQLGVANGQLVRSVNVVAVRCFFENDEGQKFQLQEEKQVFNNGNVRNRGFKHIAEKLQADEKPQEAALRGLAEELQVQGPDVSVVPLEEANSFVTTESPTYSGILSSYNTYVFLSKIAPQHYQETYIEEGEDKKTYFNWVQV